MTSNRCDRCDAEADGIGLFARAYRKRELRLGRPDPGNLCGKCAGSDTGKRIASEAAEANSGIPGRRDA